MSNNEKLMLPNEEWLSQAEAWLAEGKRVTLRAKGNSMRPFIADGKDCVVLEKTDDLRTGDIVLAHLQNGNYVLHRIYAIKGDALTLMGDGNIRATEHCRTVDVCGTVISILPAGGHPIHCRTQTEQRKARVWKALPPKKGFAGRLPMRQYFFSAFLKTKFLCLKPEVMDNRR